MSNVPEKLTTKVIDMTNPTRLKTINPVRSGQAMEQVVARIYELIKREDLTLELHRRVYRAIRARKTDEPREVMREHIVRARRAFALEEKQLQGTTKFQDRA